MTKATKFDEWVKLFVSVLTSLKKSISVHIAHFPYPHNYHPDKIDTIHLS